MVRWWHFWRLEWWARLWSALFPGREPDLGAPEEQVHRWAARAEAASARTSFITLIMTIVGLGATLYVVNLTRFQVEALLQGLKPDVQIRTATANLCPGMKDDEKFTLKILNEGDGKAREIKLVFRARLQNRDFQRLVDFEPSQKELGPRQDVTVRGPGITNWLRSQINALQAAETLGDPLGGIKSILVSSKYADV